MRHARSFLSRSTRGDSECDRDARRRASYARAMAPYSGKVRASHVLVKHADSRRPASWRDPEGAHIAKKARPDAHRERMKNESRDDGHNGWTDGRTRCGVALEIRFALKRDD